MRDFIEAAGGRSRVADIVGTEEIPLSGMNTAIVWDKNIKGPRLRFSPHNLIDALWMQLAYGLSTVSVPGSAANVAPSSPPAQARRDEVMPSSARPSTKFCSTA